MQLVILISCCLLGALSVMGETCPGGIVRCPDTMTCCQISGDSFACCPFPKATCCADHVHCCPHSMDCDIAHQSCAKKGSSVQYDWQVPVHPEMVEAVEWASSQDVIDLHQIKENANDCPDKTVCHSTFTCCKMYSGKYGCCPFYNGTCCQDGFHCCPHGSKCSASGECYSAEMNYTVSAYPMRDEKYDKFHKTEQALEITQHQEMTDPGKVCPDGYPCPEKYTCCKIEGKRYGCCPYTDARCCDDGIHCCPKGTNCNITLGTCDIQKKFGRFLPSQPLEPLKWSEDSKKIEVLNEIVELPVVLNDVICPDEHYYCPSGSTCCQLISGSYGCCPLEKATCCSNKESCCPYGYKCVADGCTKGRNILPPFLRTAAALRIPLESQSVEGEESSVGKGVSNVICPDQYPCPDGNTCCQLSDGEYGCCHMSKATCCPDKLHCCPHNYHCIDGGCRKTPWLLRSYPLVLTATTVNRKSKEITVEAKAPLQDVLCPDHFSVCPEGSTCCQLASGDYGCCPYIHATCCGDMEHCCPHGYWCSDDGCDRMPGMPQHLTPFLQNIFSAKKVN